MLDAFSVPQTRRRTFLLLANCLLFGFTAFLLGVNDNPPGIVFALIAGLFLVLAFAHPWRTARRFWLLLLASLLGLAVSALLYSVLDAAALNPRAPGLFQSVPQALAAMIFLVAALISPWAFIVSLVGLVWLSIRNRNRPASSPLADP